MSLSIFYKLLFDCNCFENISFVTNFYSMNDLQQLTWIEEMSFETEVNGHKIILDAHESVGGKDKGPRPKPLMITALMGCTAMDVVSIAKKMHVPFTKFRIFADSIITEEHPKHYEKIHLIYEFTGKDLPMDKLEKAVNMSQEKYCGVNYIYRQAIDMSFEIKVVEA